MHASATNAFHGSIINQIIPFGKIVTDRYFQKSDWCAYLPASWFSISFINCPLFGSTNELKLTTRCPSRPITYL